MRNFRVRLQIDIFAIKHHPFSVRRRHRRADALELHHVFEGEWMFAAGDIGPGPWCLREKRSCECETECDKNFHEPERFRRSRGHAKCCPGSARETRALPGVLQSSSYVRNASRAI